MNLEIMGKSEKRWRVLRILLSETIDFSVAPIWITCFLFFYFYLFSIYLFLNYKLTFYYHEITKYKKYDSSVQPQLTLMKIENNYLP